MRKKSVFQTTQKLQFLGFVLNSVSMRIYLTEIKQAKIKTSVEAVLSSQHKGVSIRKITVVLGPPVSACVAVSFGFVYKKILELEKSAALKHAKGNFDQLMWLTPKAIPDLHWWLISAADNAGAPVYRPSPQITLTTDSSLAGWGAVCNNVSTGGR